MKVTVEIKRADTKPIGAGLAPRARSSAGAIVGVLELLAHPAFGQRQPARDRWMEPDRVVVMGANEGPCAKELNACEEAARNLTRLAAVPPAAHEEYQLVAIKACRAADACKERSDVARKRKDAIEHERECNKLARAQGKPACYYENSPGEWSCRMKGCPDLALSGLRFAPDITDPCSHLRTLDDELRVSTWSGSAAEVRHLERCAQKIREVLDREHGACLCAHPEPPGQHVTHGCDHGQKSSVDVIMGSDGCVPMTPEAIESRLRSAAAATGTRRSAKTPILDPNISDSMLDVANARCVAAIRRSMATGAEWFGRCGPICNSSDPVTRCRQASSNKQQQATCLQAWSGAQATEEKDCAEWRSYAYGQQAAK